MLSGKYLENFDSLIYSTYTSSSQIDLNGYTLLVWEWIFIEPKLSLFGNPPSDIDTGSIDIDPPAILERITR
jgi:hypothetical protein